MTIEEVFATVLRVDASQLTEASSPATMKKWDSLRHMKLVVALEKAFGVTMTPADVRRMQSLAEARAILQEKGQKV